MYYATVPLLSHSTSLTSQYSTDQNVRHRSSFRRLKFIRQAKFGLKKITLNTGCLSWKQKHTNESVHLDCEQVNSMFMHRNGKDRQVATHAGMISKGSFSKQSSWFYEWRVSSFGKPLHHALVRNKTAAYASRDWYTERGLPYFTKQSLAFPETSRAKVKITWWF